VIAAQHDEDIELTKLREDIKEYVIKPVVGSLSDANTKFYINET
jgi:S-adenosylmethionine synthetase